MMTSIVDEVLAVNYLMRRPLERDEVERVLHALGLANYEIEKREPHKPSRGSGASKHRPAPTSQPNAVSRTAQSRAAEPSPSRPVGPESG